MKKPNNRNMKDPFDELFGNVEKMGAQIRDLSIELPKHEPLDILAPKDGDIMSNNAQTVRSTVNDLD